MDMRKVLSEVHACVLAMGGGYKDRIPKKVWNDICVKKDDSYNPLVDKKKGLNEQGFMEETITFIAMLHLDHWCDTEEERERLLAVFKKNDEQWQAKLSQTSSTRELLRLLHKK
jgi:hypothetical protein